MTWVILLLFGLLSAGDVATTIYALHHGFDEAMPLPGAIFSQVPPIVAMVAIKLVFCVILWWMLRLHITGGWETLRWGVITLFIGGSAFAVFHNLKVIRGGA